MSNVRMPPRKHPPSEHEVLLEHKVVPRPTEPHPWNSRFILRAREVCESCGYALTVHGTLERDIDLVAVAWVPDADDLWRFLSAFIAQTGLYIHSMEAKAHGRYAMTLKGGSGYGVDRVVDLSVIPPAR